MAFFWTEFIDMKKIIDKWEYGMKGNGDFFLNPPKDKRKELQETLFKYYDLSKNSIDALKEKKFYASYPEILNDPFDTAYEFINFHQEYAIDLIGQEVIGEKSLSEHDLMTYAKKFFKLNIYSRLGILCLTENAENYLMWSYYNNHGGFCIEFNYNKFDFSYQGPFQIRYENEIEPFELTKAEDYPVAALYQSTLKSKVWEHENEWRILAECSEMDRMELPQVQIVQKVDSMKGKRFFSWGKSVKRIILGCRFFDWENEVKSKDDFYLVKLHVKNKEKICVIESIISNKYDVWICKKAVGYFGLNLYRIKILNFDHEQEMLAFSLTGEIIN